MCVCVCVTYMLLGFVIGFASRLVSTAVAAASALGVMAVMAAATVIGFGLDRCRQLHWPGPAVSLSVFGSGHLSG